jgi:hypothetical protein
MIFHITSPMQTHQPTPSRCGPLLAHSILLVGGLALLALTSGCGTYVIRNPKTAFAGYPPVVAKHDLKIGLNLTDDLRAAEWKKHNMAIRPGGYFATNSEILVREVFREVVKMESGKSTDGTGLDAILTPKIVYVNRTQGATSFGESITSVKVEWNLSDLAGKLIWLETITGQAKGSTGWTAPEKLVQKALEELLLNSQQAMTGAEAIRSFVARRKAAAADTKPAL